jgi:hypothetical protein
LPAQLTWSGLEDRAALQLSWKPCVTRWPSAVNTLPPPFLRPGRLGGSESLAQKSERARHAREHQGHVPADSEPAVGHVDFFASVLLDELVDVGDAGYLSCTAWYRCNVVMGVAWPSRLHQRSLGR